jgi:sterol desaturase/sphingolipid hydroxylase (fatty acid hydroxylase superfamily)
MLIRDFASYWLHRLQHRSAWLWAEHEVHHSDRHMNVTTSFRHHWLEATLFTVCVVVPFAYVFRVSPAIVVVGEALGQLIGMFDHLNARISFGRWTWLLATPQSHRIHHSIQPEHHDKNFAAVFPIWDVIFNTYAQPKRDEYPATGVASVHIETLGATILWPFYRWVRMGHQSMVLFQQQFRIVMRKRPRHDRIPVRRPIR